MIREAIGTVVAGKSLTVDEAAGVMEEIMAGDATPAQIGAFVTALRLKGETSEEIAGMAQVMRSNVLKVEYLEPLVDIVGTGGDSLNTFNISTAAALVLARASAAEKAGLKPRARILGYAHAGVRPEVMGIGPVPAVEMLLKRTGLSAEDFDVIESNEAFAAQALAVNKELGLDPAKVNPNGGAIALGHPVGATGAIITVKALYELERIGGKRALVTMCIGGGQGIALAIEAL